MAVITYHKGSVCDNAGLTKDEKTENCGARNDKIYEKIVMAKTLGCKII